MIRSFLKAKKQWEYFKDIYSSGHGITLFRNGHLKTYSEFLSLEQEFETLIIIGSGSGLIPKYFRQTHLNINLSRIYFVDACLPLAGYGGPWDYKGWAYKNSSFYRECPEIILIPQTSDYAVTMFKHLTVELTFIDGDHSEEQVFKDACNYSNFSRKLVFHDSNRPDTKQAIDRFLFSNKKFVLYYESNKGAGVTFVKRQ